MESELLSALRDQVNLQKRVISDQDARFKHLQNKFKDLKRKYGVPDEGEEVVVPVVKKKKPSEEKDRKPPTCRICNLARKGNDHSKCKSQVFCKTCMKPLQGNDHTSC